jgi:hypothetical protein
MPPEIWGLIGVLVLAIGITAVIGIVSARTKATKTEAEG